MLHLGRFLALVSAVTLCAALLPSASARAKAADESTIVEAPAIIGIPGQTASSERPTDVLRPAASDHGRPADVPLIVDRPGPQRMKPFLTPDATGLSEAKRRAADKDASRAVVRSEEPSSDLLVTDPVRVSTSFEGIEFNDQVCCAPPDTQVAVGPSHVVETTNLAIAIYNKSTGARLSLTALSSFLPSTTGASLSDPRTVYDVAAARFFMTTIGWNCATVTGHVWLAVSDSSDPTGTWHRWRYDIVGTLPDFPEVGYTDDKIAVTTNGFALSSFCSGSVVWQGVKLLAWGMSDVTTLLSPAAYLITGPTYVSTLSPTIALSSTDDLYFFATIASNAFYSYRLTGTPGSFSFTLRSSGGVVGVAIPPDAPQSGGASVATNDERILQTVYLNGKAWSAATTACTPAGDSTVRACALYLQFDINSGTPVVASSAILSEVGASYFFPSIALNGNGNVVTVVNRSSASSYVSLYASELMPLPTPHFQTPVLIKSGNGPYTCTACGGENRWGDFSGAAVDPSDPGSVWVAGEWAKVLSSPYGASNQWSTWIAKISAPTICIGTLVQDTDGAVSFTGSWTYWPDSRNSGGSGRYSGSIGAKVALTFTGTCVSVVFAASTSSGIATINVDGGTVDSLDMLGSASIDFQQVKSYGGLANGSHTIEVVVSGSKNASASAYFVFFDAFVTQTAIPGTCNGTTFEQSDASIALTGTWAGWTDARLSGGSASYSNQTGAKASFHFNGTCVAVIYAGSSSAGIATIKLDGSTFDSLDMLGSSSIDFKVKKHYTGLAAGAHTLDVIVSGTKNGSSSGTFIYLDGFVAASAVPATCSGTTFQETDSSVAYSGTWSTWTDSRNSGGALKYSNQTNATATFGFTGTCVAIIFAASTSSGVATITIDGGAPDSVDMAGSASIDFQQTKHYTGLANSSHTIVVKVSGSTSSSATFIFLDGFIAAASVPSTCSGTTFQETDPSIAYGGTWNTWTDSRNSGGALKYSNQTNATATFGFTGTCVAVVFAASTSAGIATITIDGGAPDSVDMLGSASIDFQQTKHYIGLANASHTIVVKVSGTKNASSSATFIFLDGFIAAAAVSANCTGTTYQETDGSVSYGGSWMTWTDSRNSGGAAKYSNSTGATGTFTFSGTCVAVLYAASTSAGIASITIDGSPQADLDTAGSSTIDFQQKKSYLGLSSGAHTLVLTVTGTTTTGAAFIFLDGFVAP